MVQSWFRLPAPYHRLIVDSLLKQQTSSLVDIAKTQAGSPIFEALLSAPSIASKDKRAVMLKFIGHYHSLADDKNGSRVADACWATADVYLKVRHNPTLRELSIDYWRTGQNCRVTG